MASDQTPRDVIADALTGAHLDDEYALQATDDALDALDAARFAIVRKVPPGDKARSPELEAAMAAYYEVFTRRRHDHEEALAAALAAAALAAAAATGKEADRG